MFGNIAFLTSLTGGLGAAAASVLGLLCCIPAAVAFLGASVAALGAVFSPYQAPLALASVALVGTAFWIRSTPRGEDSCAIPVASGEASRFRESR